MAAGPAEGLQEEDSHMATARGVEAPPELILLGGEEIPVLPEPPGVCFLPSFPHHSDPRSLRKSTANAEKCKEM